VANPAVADIWRSAVAMLKRYGDDAMLEAAAFRIFLIRS
jgi:hypothetical protein